MGWNRRAFRMWLIDLITGLPTLVMLVVLGGLSLLIFFSVKGGAEAAAITSIVAACGCAGLFILAFILYVVLVGLLRQFFIRMAALENAGIGDSFRKGGPCSSATGRAPA